MRTVAYIRISTGGQGFESQRFAIGYVRDTGNFRSECHISQRGDDENQCEWNGG